MVCSNIKLETGHNSQKENVVYKPKIDFDFNA